MNAMTAQTNLKPTLGELFDLPDHVRSDDFVLRLTEAILRPDLTIRDYVVTDQLRRCFDEALSLVKDAITGRRTEVVHVVGGGAQNALLNQLTANVVGRRVVAGPIEATVLGNLLVQARTVGDIPVGMALRELARRSSHLVEHSPMSPARMPAPAVSVA